MHAPQISADQATNSDRVAGTHYWDGGIIDNYFDFAILSAQGLVRFVRQRYWRSAVVSQELAYAFAQVGSADDLSGSGVSAESLSRHVRHED